GNPAVTYDHIFNRCAFTGAADGYGPLVETGIVPHPVPFGTGDVGEDVLIPSATHHAPDGAVTLEEAYWCSLASARAMPPPTDIIAVEDWAIATQQMFQLVDQMGDDMFGLDGFVLWDINGNLDLETRDASEPLGALDLGLARTVANDEEGDALTPLSDLRKLEATATPDKVVADLSVATLAHTTAGVEDYVEYLVTVNDADYGMCFDRGSLAVYDYSNGRYMTADEGSVAYDLATGVIHLELRIANLFDATLPANVHARSRYTNCTNAAVPQEDDRVPDAGEISTSEDDDTTNPGLNEVRVRLDGPGGTVANGVATLNVAAKTWSFDPAGALADGTYTATAEHWFDDGTGLARVEGPVGITFTVGAPDTTPPTAPANLFALPTGSTSISLTWDAATDDTGVAQYRVYRAGAPGVPTLPANLVATTPGLSLVDGGLAPSTDYYYVVVAEDAAGNDGPASNEAHARTADPPPVTETVTLRLDGTFLAELTVDTVGGPDPATWTTSLDTASISNGFHDLRAAYDDGRGGSDEDAVRFNVQNGVAIAILDPADGDPVGQSFTATGGASNAAPGSTVQLRASNGNGVVQDWTQAAFDGSAWSVALQGMPFGALTLDARLRDGTLTVAEDSVQVQVVDTDHLLIQTANGIPVGDDPIGPLSGTVDVQGASHLAPEPDPRANVPPVAVITDPLVVGRGLSASGATSYDPDGSIVSWAWDLGNGDHRSGAALSYAYPDPGTYTLTLTVMDNRGAIGQAQLGPFEVTDTTPADFVVDAGDSQFVRIGSLLTLSAAAYGAALPVSFAWDTDANGAPDRAGQSIQVDTTGLAPGARSYTVSAVDSTGGAGTDTVQVFLYNPSTQRQTFQQLVPLGLPDELAGAGGADQATFHHSMEVPPGSTSLDLVLDWTIYAEVTPEGAPVFGRGGPNDLDLYATSPDGLEINSADFNRPEEIHLTDPAAGTWDLRVESFVVLADTYTLTADLGVAPPNPVPRPNQVNDVCFETDAQTLVASATVATGDALTGAWDLDGDGAFDDATGFEATTNFPADGAAHLVRFRATSAAGYRATIYLGVRHLADCPDAPSVVVVGIADTGINPYHRDFAGELLPDATLRAYTTADPEVRLPDDAPVYHKLTGDLLPFTKHPSRYIPGFPADMPALKLTLGGGYYEAQDTTAVWGRGHAAIPLGKWFWIPGTKIIAAIDTTDAAPVNSLNPDSIPILDQDGHGTASASTAAGNFWGSCPRCVLVVTEGLGGDTLLYNYPWIDFISVSGGSLGNVGTPVLTDVASNKAAAERGQTISYAAGNGIDLSFVTPEQTYLSESVGPDWNIRVGAVSKSSNNVVHGTGKPVDWSSYGSGSIAAACPNNYSGNCGHSG
ncbi:MAG TPA: PKD domain-containing protein, partial [Candidatus Thermoplasmatota archaeon]|nr:PKD domain-containing protein [Candidatus Thermoplasmatota archaeon]